jgi:hypothetical protein
MDGLDESTGLQLPVMLEKKLLDSLSNRFKAF